jgi:hypothetical protein
MDDHLPAVDEAAAALVRRTVAAMEELGERVWWRRYPSVRRVSDGPSRVEYFVSFFMALGDDEWEFGLDLRYRGPDGVDSLPEGFDRFTVFIEGGKGGIDDLLRASAQPRTPVGRSSRDVRDAEERRLEFVARLPSADLPTDWLLWPDVHLRCSECSVENDVVVAVDDPAQECLCGALRRGADGALALPDEDRFTAVYRLARG